MNDAVCVTRAYAQQYDLIVSFLRQHLEDFFSIRAAIVEMRSGPGQVVIEFMAAGEECLEVNEVLQSLFLVQVVDKREMAGGVAHGRKILEKGYLHVGVIQHHVGMPGEARLLLDEKGVDVTP